MRLKPITVTIVLLLVVTSLSVAGCTTTSNTNQTPTASGSVSTDYPTSGRSELIAAAIEHQRNSLPSSTEFTVEWKNNTWAVTTEKRADGSFVTGYTHYPSVSEASAWYDSLIRYVYGKDASASTWYHDITGKWPTVSRATAEPGEPETTLQQYDALIMQTQLQNETTATKTPTVTKTPTPVPDYSSTLNRIYGEGAVMTVPFHKTTRNGKLCYEGTKTETGRTTEIRIYPTQTTSDAIAIREQLIANYKSQGWTTYKTEGDTWFGTLGNEVVGISETDYSVINIPSAMELLTPIST